MPQFKESAIRTAFFASGSGTTAEAAVNATRNPEMNLERIQPVAFVVSRPDAKAVDRANALGIPVHILVPSYFSSHEEFGTYLNKLLKGVGIDLVAQTGWLAKTPSKVVEEYKGRIFNQHPGKLDPGRGDPTGQGRKLDFGGRGMYGRRVTAATLVYEWVAETFEPWTDATTHFVTDEYDDGEIIRHEVLYLPRFERGVTVAAFRNDQYYKRLLLEATKDVSQRLLPLEHKNVVETLREFATQERVKGFTRGGPLIPLDKAQILYDAKKLAVELFQNG